MPKVVGVKFKNTAKSYYFEAGELEYKEGQGVIVETAKGNEYGIVTALPKDVSDSEIVPPLRPVVRLVTERDIQRMNEFESRKEETMRTVEKKIEESGLEMRLSSVEYAFDGSKLIVYFTAAGRVDFRDLVKELASTFHMRIELRQIGERDECKLLGGLGPCGRACCCSGAMNEYAHVTVKMAKNQNLSLNPTKISGLCGRLMCCLAYENAYYTEVNKRMPKVGAFVALADGRKGVVTGVNQLKESVRVKIENGDKLEFADVKPEEVTVTAKPCEKPNNQGAEKNSEDKPQKLDKRK